MPFPALTGPQALGFAKEAELAKEVAVILRDEARVAAEQLDAPAPASPRAPRADTGFGGQGPEVQNNQNIVC